MQALFYKTRRSLINALRRSVRDPRQLVALLFATLYGAAALGMIVAMLTLPLPAGLLRLAQQALGSDPAVQLAALRGGLTITLLLLATTAVFQNPLLQFAPADVDILFATPVPLRLVLLGRLLQNHLRALLAAYFFWGLALAPALRLAGYQPWPLGAWALAGLTCLFASLDQGFGALQIFFSAETQRPALSPSKGSRHSSIAYTAPPERVGGVSGEGYPPRPSLFHDWLVANGARWLQRAALLLLLGAAGVALLGVLARIVSGNWGLLGSVLGGAGGVGWIGAVLQYTLLLPLGLASDLLFLPTARVPGLASALVPLAGLALLDLLTGLLLLRRSDWLLEAALAPGVGRSGLLELLRAAGPHPLRIIRALWNPDQLPHERAPARVYAFGSGAWAHVWRRLIELRRAPLRNLLAVLALGLLPLAIYNPARGYSFTRLLTAIVFSGSLGTQLFSDLADHLRYANLELAAPLRRWWLLAAALLPRLALYWLGGLLLLLGVGLSARGAQAGELLALAFWYPLVLLPLLSLRGALGFLFPAAGIPGQRDPVQAVVVMLAHGLLVLLVIGLALLPFGVLLALTRAFGLSRVWFWPVIFTCSSALCGLCWVLLVWAYRRYEPGEA